MKNDKQNIAGRYEDVEACLATPKGAAQDQDDLEGMTQDELIARTRTLEGMLKQRVKEVDRLYQEGRNPRGVIEMLQQELHAERETVASLRRRLWDKGGEVRKLEEEIAEQREKVVPTFGAPIAGMTFPFTIDTPHRDIVELTVTGVDITDGVHQVHMTADIRLPEAQPQEVPSPVGEPTFVEVRDVPGVVTQLSLDLVTPLTDPVAEPGEDASLTERRHRRRSGILEGSGPREQEGVETATTASTGFTPPAVGAYAPSLDEKGNTVGRSQEITDEYLTRHPAVKRFYEATRSGLLAYEQAGALPDNAPKLTANAADTTEPAATSSTELVTRTVPDTISGWEVLKDKEGRLLVRDVDIAEKAGLAQSRNIRQIIKANLAALEELGPLRTERVRKAIAAGFGTSQREVDEYWLNERQALYLVQRLRTVDGKEMHKNALNALMALFDYYRDMPPAVPDSTMDWHKYSMEREQLRLNGLRLLEVKNSKTVALLKAENDGQAEVITAQYNELTEYKDFFAGGDSGVSTVALNMGYNEQFLFVMMREHGLIVSGRTAGWSYGLQTDPYKEYIDKGWFVVRPNLPYRWKHPFTGKWGVKQSSTTLITNLGWFNLHKMYGEHGTHWNKSKPTHLFPISPCNRKVTAEELDNYRRKLWAMWTKEALTQGMHYADIPPYPTQKDEDE